MEIFNSPIIIAWQFDLVVLEMVKKSISFTSQITLFCVSFKQQQLIYFKMIKKTIQTALCMMALATMPLFAQQKPKKTLPPPTAAKVGIKSTNNVAEAEGLKTKFYEFIDAYANVEKNKDKEKVLKFMTSDVLSTLISFNLAGKMNILHSDYKGFSAYLDKLTTTEGMQVNYVLENIDKVYVNGNLGMIVYGVEYELRKGGEVWSKGHETVTLTYKKVLNEWKIVQYVVTQVEDEKTKVQCVCELTQDKNTQDFVMKTTIPNGRSYTTEINPVGFMQPQEAKVIGIGEKFYKWYPNGEVKALEEPTQVEGVIPETLIGEVKDMNDKLAVVSLIISKHLYKTNCNAVDLKVVK